MTEPTAQAARMRMIDLHLRRRGIRSSRVLDAMLRVPRERFVPPNAVHEAYDDRAMSIACGQTISQPYIVALMTQLLELTGEQRVLEIGTGSGYQTALLAELAGEVISVERHGELSQQAGRTLLALGYRNVELVVGDGTAGYPSRAPFDRIIVTAAAAECPPPLTEQLADGGVLVGPFGSPEHQTMQVIRRRGERVRQVNSIGCRFVPLIGEHGGYT